MAFYRNYTNQTIEQRSVLDGKDQGQGMDRILGNNEEVEATSSDNEVAVQETSRVESMPPPVRRTVVGGKWGSNFWKDCLPMESHGVSESGEESKSGSEYKNEDRSEDEFSDGENDRANELEDDDMGKEGGKIQSVPPDEMLSDEYYEQDGDDQSDSLHHRAINRSSGFSLKPPPRPVASNKFASRKSKASKANYDDQDAEYEDDDDDDEVDGMYLFTYGNFPCKNYYLFWCNLTLVHV